MRQEKTSNHALLGKCPVCGQGNIIYSHGNYVCTNHFTNNGGRSRCKFCIPENYYGVEWNDALVKELIENGETDYLQMKLPTGIPYNGKIKAIPGDRLAVVPLNHYAEGAVCPNCGGKILKTKKGYACENQVKKNQTCSFFFPNRLANRFITEDELISFLNGEQRILDGFHSNNKKPFSGYLTMNDEGVALVSSKVEKCPSCGGDILIGTCAFNCSNYKPEDGCEFSIMRSYNGHSMTVKEVQQLLDTGEVSFPCSDQYGHLLRGRLVISENNGIIELRKEYYHYNSQTEELMNTDQDDK